jgi:hypothetical protein
MGIIRILFLADTHLGFDLPSHPRIQRHRKGPEFFANFKRALLPALQLNLHPAVMEATELRSYPYNAYLDNSAAGIIKL